eukprot:5057989-Alexandrium_andersonii.AAC.1
MSPAPAHVAALALAPTLALRGPPVRFLARPTQQQVRLQFSSARSRVLRGAPWPLAFRKLFRGPKLA